MFSLKIKILLKYKNILKNEKQNCMQQVARIRNMEYHPCSVTYDLFSMYLKFFQCGNKIEICLTSFGRTRKNKNKPCEIGKYHAIDRSFCPASSQSHLITNKHKETQINYLLFSLLLRLITNYLLKLKLTHNFLPMFSHIVWSFYQ